jgi:hypothetical protein
MTLRSRKRDHEPPVLDLWFYPATLGQMLPPLPIWLNLDTGLSLDLETSYEETCRLLRIA